MVDITRVGQASLNSLNGKLVFEQDNNRIIGRDSNNVIRLSIDAANDFAVNYYDQSGNLISSNDSSNGLLFYNSSGVPRAQFNSAGIKIAQNGVSVLSATSAQLVLNSNQNTFKITVSGTTSLAVPSPLTSGTTSTATVAHGLSSIPAVIAYLNNPTANFFAANTYYALPVSVPVNTGTYQPGLVVSLNVDATNLKFTVTNYSTISLNSIGTLNFKYYLLQETAN